MAFSQSFLSKRKHQIEQLSQDLIGKQIKVIIDKKETDVFVINIIDTKYFHHYSSELLFHCKKEQSDAHFIKVEIWFFSHGGKYRLFQPHVGEVFNILNEDELIKLFSSF